MTEDKMVGWHHRLNGHEFEQALGVGDEQGSLACCSPWVRKELDSSERLNCTELNRLKGSHFRQIQLQSQCLAAIMYYVGTKVIAVLDCEF